MTKRLSFCLLAALTACSPQPSVIYNARAIDGDTFASAGIHYRLTWNESTYPDAPEMPGHCRRGRDCAAGNPYQAQAFLQSMLNDGVNCQTIGLDRYGRTLANCNDLLSGRNLNTALVASGNAQVCRRLDGHTVCTKE